MEQKMMDEALESMNAKGRERFDTYLERTTGDMSMNAFFMPDEYDDLRCSVEGAVALHERFVTNKKPYGRLIFEMQHYLCTMLRLSLQRPLAEGEDIRDACSGRALVMNATVHMGEKTVSSAEPARFLNALFEDLPDAESFDVDCTLTGVVREFYSTEPDEDGAKKYGLLRRDAAWTGAGMLDMLEKYKRRNMFEYKMVAFYPDCGEWHCAKILNGKDIDLDAAATEDILDCTSENWWESETINIYADYDFGKHPDILAKQQALVRSATPETEVRYCEEMWDEGQPGFLFSGQWECKSLREVRDFLDKVNELLIPIKEEVRAGSDYFWVIPESFGYATCVWTDEGFKIKGLMF